MVEMESELCSRWFGNRIGRSFRYTSISLLRTVTMVRGVVEERTTRGRDLRLKVETPKHVRSDSIFSFTNQRHPESCPLPRPEDALLVVTTIMGSRSPQVGHLLQYSSLSRNSPHTGSPIKLRLPKKEKDVG
jgi:hypothetical protein